MSCVTCQAVHFEYFYFVIYQCLGFLSALVIASGHRLYAKSAYVYLQMMIALPETHPDVHKKFEEGT